MTMQTILRPSKGNTHEVSFTGTSARNSTAFTSSKIRIYATQACYIKFGDDTVTASSSDYDIYLPASLAVDLYTGGAQHVAIIEDSSAGTAYINQWESNAL